MEEIRSFFLKDWPSRLILAILTAFSAFVYAHGKDAIKAEGQKIVIETVKPGMDSLKAQVDTLKEKVADLKAEQEKQGRVQQEFFGAMMDVIPGLKKSVKDLGKQNSEVSIKKAETEKLLGNLTETQ
jgi:hypothetical protein